MTVVIENCVEVDQNIVLYTSALPKRRNVQAVKFFVIVKAGLYGIAVHLVTFAAGFFYFCYFFGRKNIISVFKPIFLMKTET